MLEPKISVIIPVYNTEKYLKRCMDSLLGQTLSQIEIILVDDGSKAECANLCDEFAKADERVKVVHKENAGPGFARNAGLSVASGEYIGFVDSDDYISPTMYEELYNAAKKYDTDLVISGVCFVDGNMFGKAGEYIEKSYFDRDTVFEKEDMKKLLLGIVGALPYEQDDSRYGVAVWKNLFRHSMIKEKNLLFQSERVILSEDTLFMVDVAKVASSCVGIAGAFYCYCRNDDSFSKSYKKDKLEKAIVHLDALEDSIKDVVSEDEYRLYLDRLTQAYGRILSAQEIMHAKAEKISYGELKKRLNAIVSCDKIRKALDRYPWYKLPKKQAAFAFAMKYRLFFLKKLMVELRDN